jgi:hypothetical protein
LADARGSIASRTIEQGWREDVTFLALAGGRVPILVKVC